MSTYDNNPTLDGWVCEPRAWDADNCCPATCVACEPNETHLVRGEN